MGAGVETIGDHGEVIGGTGDTVEWPGDHLGMPTAAV